MTDNTPALNENQFFNIEEKGRKGLNQIILKTGDDMWASRPGSMDSAGKEKYFKTSVINISNNEKLMEFAQHKQGLYQIYKCLSEAIQVGLVIGGENPLAEIAEFNKGKLGLNIRAEGYAYLVSNGKNAMFKEINPQIVKKGENFSIDYAKNEYIHSWDGSTELGDIVGVVIEFTKHDNTKMIKYVPLKQIHASKAKSKGHKYYLEEKEKKPYLTSPWVTDEPQMCIKAAMKIVLKPYAKQIKALSFALSVEEADNYREQPIEDRVVDRINSILDEPENLPLEKIITKDDPKDENKEDDQNTGEQKINKGMF